MYQFHQEQHSYALLLSQQKLKHDSWVMTSPGAEGFVKLPNERILYTSPPRTSLQISTPNPFPGSQPYTSKNDAGVAYITNQRVIYPALLITSFAKLILDRLSPNYSLYGPPIFLLSDPQPSRHIRKSTIFWCKLLDSIVQASSGRWNP